MDMDEWRRTQEEVANLRQARDVANGSKHLAEIQRSTAQAETKAAREELARLKHAIAFLQFYATRDEHHDEW
jgi:transcription elongation GreA/GreB family factor